MPDTIVTRFIDRASSDPVRHAFFIYPMGALHSLSRLTWGDWITESRSVGGALLSLHAAKGDRVAIFSDSRALWPVAAMGVMMCGLVPVAIHPLSTADALVARITECGASIVMVDTIARFKLLRSIQASLPHHITIVCDDLEPLRTSIAEGVYEFESWCKAGAKALDEFEALRNRLNERIESVSAADSAFTTYASGHSASADCRAITLTQENLVATTAAIVSTFSLTFSDRVSSYKALDEPFEFALAICATIFSGHFTTLLEHGSDAFSATRQFEASVFSGAPRAFDRVREAFDKARETGSYLRDTACELLGRHCRLAILTGQVLPEQLHRDLRSGGVALATVYGSAQQSCIAVNGLSGFDDSAIGFPFAGVQWRADEHDNLMVRRSPLTFAEYRGDVRSDDADDASWFSTGDRVVATDAGSYRISGYTRDLLKFEDGRYLAPGGIETALSALPLVAHAVCHTDGRNVIVAVLSLDRQAVEAWAHQQGVAMPWDALVALPLVYDELARGVAKINARHDIPERVVAFAPTDLEFTVDNGELNDAGEVVRPVIASRFRHIFADLHQQAQS
ncbi:MAG: AMP-binding protein [Gemmatimonadaceae bacterium]